jgi:hypothetical protein
MEKGSNIRCSKLSATQMKIQHPSISSMRNWNISQKATTRTYNNLETKETTWNTCTSVR